ncbi:hypothetical protein BTR23_23430 [Alkalihalophilus pseudofirmus]|nr:hypothetical protein BTR23_23430 [Alkalihalophilus pseudofirmus]
MNLLIVDDEPLEREVLRDVFDKDNLGVLKCMEAMNGVSAVDTVKNNQIDIVLMDIKMPIMDGITAAKIIKQHDPNIKVVFLTAYNEFDYALQTIKIGAEDFLLKPVRPIEVVEAIKKVIDNINDTKDDTFLADQSNSVIETMNNYIDIHLTDKLTLDQMSGIVHLHPQYISRLFKQVTGMTFTEFITMKRLEKSKELLIQSNKSISEISELCGFTDPNYFTRVFRKFEGQPPKQFRQNEKLLKKEKLNKLYFNRIM